MTQKEYFEQLKSEIKKDPSNQGYKEILETDWKTEGEKLLSDGREYLKKAEELLIKSQRLSKEGNKLIVKGNPLIDKRCKYMKIAKKINEGMGEILGFPIVRTNIVQHVLENK